MSQHSNEIFRKWSNKKFDDYFGNELVCKVMSKMVSDAKAKKTIYPSSRCTFGYIRQEFIHMFVTNVVLSNRDLSLKHSKAHKET